MGCHKTKGRQAKSFKMCWRATRKLACQSANLFPPVWNFFFSFCWKYVLGWEAQAGFCLLWQCQLSTAAHFRTEKTNQASKLWSSRPGCCQQNLRQKDSINKLYKLQTLSLFPTVSRIYMFLAVKGSSCIKAPPALRNFTPTTQHNVNNHRFVRAVSLLLLIKLQQARTHCLLVLWITQSK